MPRAASSPDRLAESAYDKLQFDFPVGTFDSLPTTASATGHSSLRAILVIALHCTHCWARAPMAAY